MDRRSGLDKSVRELLLLLLRGGAGSLTCADIGVKFGIVHRSLKRVRSRRSLMDPLLMKSRSEQILRKGRESQTSDMFQIISKSKTSVSIQLLRSVRKCWI